MADPISIERSYVAISNGAHTLVPGADTSSVNAGLRGAAGPQPGINLRYPNGPGGVLGQKPYEKWILFEARSGRHILRNTVTAEGGSVDRTLSSVALYLPDGALKSDLTVRYDAHQLGDLGGPLLDAAIQARKTAQQMSAASSSTQVPGLGSITEDSFISQLEGLGGSVAKSGISGLFGRLAHAAQASAEKMVSGASDATELFFGASVNPRTDLLFQYPEYRTHSLTFTLIPRTKAEANEIDKIVSFFQYYMLPSFGNPNSVQSFLIGYPYEFEISMFSEFNLLDQHHMNTIGRSVLRNISVVNSTEGRVSFIESNGEYYPASTTITMDLQEVRLLGRDSAEIVRGGVQQFPDPRGI